MLLILVTSLLKNLVRLVPLILWVLLEEGTECWVVVPVPGKFPILFILRQQNYESIASTLLTTRLRLLRFRIRRRFVRNIIVAHDVIKSAQNNMRSFPMGRNFYFEEETSILYTSNLVSNYVNLFFIFLFLTVSFNFFITASLSFLTTVLNLYTVNRLAAISKCVFLNVIMMLKCDLIHSWWSFWWKGFK